MKEELVGLYEGAKVFLGEMERIETGERNGREEEGGGKEKEEEGEGRKMVLSLGATPTATAIQNLVWEEEDETTEAVRKYREILKQVQENFEVEFHAGVYPGMSVFSSFYFFYFLIVHHLEDSLLTHDDTHKSWICNSSRPGHDRIRAPSRARVCCHFPIWAFAYSSKWRVCTLIGARSQRR